MFDFYLSHGFTMKGIFNSSNCNIHCNRQTWGYFWKLIKRWNLKFSSGFYPVWGLLLLWWSRTVLVHYLVWFCKMGFIFSHFNPKYTLIKVPKRGLQTVAMLFFNLNIHTNIPECSDFEIQSLTYHSRQYCI